MFQIVLWPMTWKIKVLCLLKEKKKIKVLRDTLLTIVFLFLFFRKPINYSFELWSVEMLSLVKDNSIFLFIRTSFESEKKKKQIIRLRFKKLKTPYKQIS